MFEMAFLHLLSFAFSNYRNIKNADVWKYPVIVLD